MDILSYFFLGGGGVVGGIFISSIINSFSISLIVSIYHQFYQSIAAMQVYDTAEC